jgi:hypothetical protein
LEELQRSFQAAMFAVNVAEHADASQFLGWGNRLSRHARMFTTPRKSTRA